MGSEKLVVALGALGLEFFCDGGGGLLGGGTDEIEGEQAREDFFVARTRGPPVGGGDGGVLFFMREIEPCGALVIERGERANLEFGGALFVARHGARVTRGADPSHGVDGVCLDET